jgi:ribonuclease R
MAGDVAAPLVETVINPLYEAYAALARERDARGPLAIDVPERRVVIGDDGYISSIHPRDRLDAHRLIEEFMIAANVCAAETCEELGQPCMYRVHEDPDLAKVEALRDFLDSLNIRLAKGQRLRPSLFNSILEKVANTPNQHVVNEVVLRTQSQAVYSPDNLGHFGLALQRYAHFTSPIRRYADLLVHRAIILGMGFGKDGLPEDSVERFPELGEQISKLERRAMSAERDALDRFTAAFMADRVGATFMGRISGVTRFGLFVSLDETGADGLVPVSALEDDYYDHDERHHSLVGRRRGRVFRLGDRVEVRLIEADAITGGLRLEVLRDEGPTLAGRAPGARDKLSSTFKKTPAKTSGKSKKPKGESRKARKKK